MMKYEFGPKITEVEDADNYKITIFMNLNLRETLLR
jgi:hypothetical protein